jgi:hypothetical protein
MGLDAVVYRSKANLPFDADAVGAVLDISTGEYYFADPAVEPAREREFPRETRIAVHKRIGNIAAVAALRNSCERLLNGDSIILSKVLYSGTHCGDSVPVCLMSQLEEELTVLQRYSENNADEALMQFVADLQDLAAAASSQSNPIVF